MKIKIIRVDPIGEQFKLLIPGSIHEVIEPPKNKRKFPNNDVSVWIMGKSEPVRIFISGRDREAFIIDESDTGKL